MGDGGGDDDGGVCSSGTRHTRLFETEKQKARRCAALNFNNTHTFKELTAAYAGG